MDNATVDIAVGLRLGAPIVRPHNVYAELKSQSMIIMDYLVATAQDDIHATIKSTRFCVVHLTPPMHMLIENHTRSVVAMTRDQMEQLRFCGRGAVVWLGTPPDPTHNTQSYVQANSRKVGSAATGAELKKLQKYQDICAGVDFIPVAIRHLAFGVSMSWNLSRRLDAGFQQSATNHGQHHSGVSGLQWLFNAAMPPALLGHCRSTVQ